MIDSGFALAMVIAGTLAGLAAGYLFHEVVVAGYSRAVDDLARDQLLELAERRRPGRVDTGAGMSLQGSPTRKDGRLDLDPSRDGASRHLLDMSQEEAVDGDLSKLITQDLGYDLELRTTKLVGIPTWWEF